MPTAVGLCAHRWFGIILLFQKRYQTPENRYSERKNGREQKRKAAGKVTVKNDPSKIKMVLHVSFSSAPLFADADLDRSLLFVARTL